MNILKFFRNSRLIGFSAICFLIFSCSQYDLNQERAFDFAIYEAYKDNPLSKSTKDLIASSLRNRTSNLSFKRQILEQINQQYNSNLDISDPMLELSDYNVDDMKAYSLTNGLLNQSEINMLDELASDIQATNLDDALLSFEDKVVSLNLDQSTFEKYNYVANSLKVIDEENPSLFDSSTSRNSNGPIACIVAFIVWVAGIVGFVTGCATVFLCALAGVALLAATADLVLECVPNTPGAGLE